MYVTIDIVSEDNSTILVLEGHENEDIIHIKMHPTSLNHQGFNITIKTEDLKLAIRKIFEK